VVDVGDLDEAGHDGPSQLFQLVIDHHVVFIRGVGRDAGHFREVACSPRFRSSIRRWSRT
jgi:hypothetical protein